jgi:putative salt-induced outer membrane protein
MGLSHWTAALAILAGVAPLAAQTPAPPKRTRLTASAGLVDVAGNTRLMSLTGDQRLEHRTADARWMFSQNAGAVYGRTDDSTTATLLKAGLRADRALSARWSAFLGAGFERNRFAGISRRFEEVLGLGWKALSTPRDRLVLEAGASFNQQRSTLDQSDNFVAARGAAAFRHQFTATAYFEQLAEFLPSLENGDDLRINTETALVAPISARIALKASYAIRFDNLPAPGFKKTDRILTSGIQITF